MRLKEPFVFFVDRSLGSSDVPNALRAVIVGGERVEVHDQHFAQDTNDDVWLATVGTHGWVALTKDRAIRYNPLELRALLVAKTAFFVFSGGQARGAQGAKLWQQDYLACDACSVAFMSLSSRVWTATAAFQ